MPSLLDDLRKALSQIPKDDALKGKFRSCKACHFFKNGYCTQVQPPSKILNEYEAQLCVYYSPETVTTGEITRTERGTQASQIDLLKKVNLIELITKITEITTLKTLETLSEVTNIKNIESLDLIDLITTISTVSAITNILNVESVDLIDNITNLGTLNLLNTVNLIKSISSIDSITNIANIESVDLIDEITKIGLIQEANIFPNFIKNSGFELNDGFYPSFWSKIGEVTVEEQPYHGTWACRLRRTTGIDAYITQALSPLNSNEILFSLWHHTTNGKNMRVTLSYTDGTSSDHNDVGTGVYKQLLITPTANKYLKEIKITTLEYNTDIYIDEVYCSNVKTVVSGTATVTQASAERTLPHLSKTDLRPKFALGVNPNQSVVAVPDGYKAIIYGYSIANKDDTNVGYYVLYLVSTSYPLYAGKIPCDCPVLKTFVHPIEGGNSEDIKIDIGGSTDTDVIVFAKVVTV